MPKPLLQRVNLFDPRVRQRWIAKLRARTVVAVAGVAYYYSRAATPRPGATSTPAITPSPTPLTTASPTAVSGDLNQDGAVNLGDLQQLLQSWSQPAGTGDVNGDGARDVYDLSILLTHWTS
ncbi:MAG TPA: dockerin type I domain-containing protein [Candidatus Saccharimonadia bacterium]